LYFGGLGGSFTNKACIGYVMTRLREHAEELTSLETARLIADKIGGTVCPV
jgi:hypothetical protein